MTEEKKEITILRGQAWVELHGIFYPAQLRDIANRIEKKCKGLEKNGDKE